MSGSDMGSARDGAAGTLPDRMAAAVYQSPGVVTVEERPVPRPGPDQVLREGVTGTLGMTDTGYNPMDTRGCSPRPTTWPSSPRCCST